MTIDRRAFVAGTTLVAFGSAIGFLPTALATPGRNGGAGCRVKRRLRLYARSDLCTHRRALEQVDGTMRPAKPPRLKRDTELLAWLDAL